ncbi:probable glycosyltransferase At5g25310 isoform X4 [Zea mays]|uniref:Exostosin GT47 domain-containing protein n=2 Tax=Zea mays TaxID=4577 RepID=A0A804QJM2_MAIZE|nr:probable glycosyltransferase At5g25310 isoform X4 [Zea mays]|eukprot:XP_020398318.1 probable glycosyltransferase At5g25310 isoform X4 [Zea mays]
MPHHHHTNPSHPPAARKLLSWRRVVAACAVVAALALLLAAAPATEDPSRWRSYLLGPLPGDTRKETVAAAVVAGSFAGPAASTSSPSEAPLSSFGEINLSARIAPAAAPSMFLAPSSSPAEIFYDGSMEEPEHPDIKRNPPKESSPFLKEEPIFSGLPTMSSDVNGENVMDTKSVLPVTPEAPLWSTAADEELIYAKKEITNAPLTSDDPDLYAPLFRNVSIFKRSYELMERLLKVFIYHDGAKPIFHSPELKGIYASEGWFMKLMETNQNFVVRDPNTAHLFYLPYSSRQLEHNLYVPGSNTIEPLSIFVKNYIDLISAKYPYWNRTKGADHFFVACHDWGPYTTKLHDELRKNTIKALCNADLSEGFFIRGKDVSLPETFLRSPRRPLRDIGGRPAAQRTILAFFAGQMHGRVRPVLLKYWGNKDDDMRIYSRLPHRITRKRNYVQHMKSSKYCICPMGYEVNSPRIVEAIYYECVPVIIADHFVLPFDAALNWSTFSVVVPESDVPKLKQILLAIPESRYITLQANVKRVQKHFMWHPNPVKYDIFHMILHSVWFSRVNQIR